jgi:hypothetical protein
MFYYLSSCITIIKWGARLNCIWATRIIMCIIQSWKSRFLSRCSLSFKASVSSSVSHCSSNSSSCFSLAWLCFFNNLFDEISKVHISLASPFPFLDSLACCISGSRCSNCACLSIGWERRVFGYTAGTQESLLLLEPGCVTRSSQWESWCISDNSVSENSGAGGLDTSV